MTMRNLGKAAAVVAIPLALVGVLAVPSSAGGGQVIRYLSTAPQNTDLDLGAPGLSAGDQQVFLNQATREGKTIGYELGEAVIVEVSGPAGAPTGLKAVISSTVVLDKGTLMMTGAFIEDFATGPTGFTAAITGGTGRYRGATGEATGEFIPGTADVMTTIRLQ